jgi:hypothetical protein
VAIVIDTFKRIEAKYLEVIEIAESLHLASVAKAIELQRGCQIFIAPVQEEIEISNYQSFTANCEPFTILQKEEQDKWDNVFIQHFVYYRTNEDSEIERFYIAHELAHLAIHWPLRESASKRKVYTPLPGIGRFFLVLHNKEEDEEADAFAILLGINRPKPKRPEKTNIISLVMKKANWYAKKGVLFS